MTTDTVTVITLTRARPELALRAITSVRGQDYDDDVTHVVIIDECGESADVLGALKSSPGRGLRIVQTKRLASEHGPASATRGSVYGRMGRLINAAVAESRTRWIALLDDDNEFTPDHLRSLR
ncbi:MAG: glycosyltransferase family 2 protein, partial [Microthrixaceae bacterium]|nr:glycosyltransferase family 2 protein [Microthrixaceae bacterium]